MKNHGKGKAFFHVLGRKKPPQLPSNSLILQRIHCKKCQFCVLSFVNIQFHLVIAAVSFARRKDQKRSIKCRGSNKFSRLTFPPPETQISVSLFCSTEHSSTFFAINFSLENHFQLFPVPSERANFFSLSIMKFLKLHQFTKRPGKVLPSIDDSVNDSANK
jgi:hypothetical protein